MKYITIQNKDEVLILLRVLVIQEIASINQY